jgi:hypothetical protein
MNKRLFLTVLTGMGLAAGIFLYNYWAYHCGRCTAASFFVISPPAVILLFFNVAAFLLLCRVKSGNRRRIDRQHCTCGSLLHRSWQFCPDCGAVRRQSAAD